MPPVELVPTILAIGLVTALVVALTGAPLWAQAIACFVLGVVDGFLLRRAERRDR